MRISVKLKLVLIFVMVILVPTTVITSVNLWFNLERLEKEFQTNNLNALNNALNILVEYARQAENIAGLLAETSEIKEKLESGDIQEVLEAKQELWFAAIIEVFDKTRKLCARSHAGGPGIRHFFTNPEAVLIDLTLALEEQTKYIKTPGGIALKAPMPIVDLETLETSGMIIVTYPFNVQFLQAIKERIRAEVTLQWNTDGSVVSTIQDKDGIPIEKTWGTAVFSDYGLVEETHFQQQEYIGSVLYSTAYTFIKNPDGRIIGILSTAINSSAIEHNKQDALRIIFISFFIVFLLAVTVGFLTARSFTLPIYQLLRTIRSIAEGNLQERVKIDKNDEIGDLARAFNEMTADLQKKQRSLEKAEEKYRNIFENAFEGIFQCTPDGYIISANPALARIMGYKSPYELISSLTNLSDKIFIDDDSYKDFRCFIDGQGRIVGYETYLYQKNGNRIWISLSFRPVKDMNENMVFYEGSLVDVTARKEKEKAERARKAAEAASNSKSEFLANMSHEIRTPMNGIIGMTELLMTTTLTSRQKDYAKAISDSANGLLTVLNDILDFSKIQAGKLTIESEQFNLRKLVEQTGLLFAGQVRDKGIEILTKYSPDMPAQVVGDSTRIRQVLANLTGNAVKFTEQGYVLIEAECRKKTENRCSFLLKVSDTGIGIPEELQQLIFDKFSQADESTTRKFGGTGLGLAISRQLVEMMGGTIGVKSKPGRGSIFFFRLELPFSEEICDELSDDELQPAEQKTVSSVEADILLAEDNHMNQRVAAGILRRYGCVVDIAENGMEAVDRFREKAYDLVFMDAHMPVMDGFEATKAIRQREKKNTHTPIIAMTALAMEGDREMCIDAGMDDYISKPITSKAVLDILLKFCTARQETIKYETPEPEKEDKILPVLCVSQLLDISDNNEETIQELIEEFMKDAPVYFDDLKDAIKSGGHDEIYKKAHRLKGLASNAGGEKLQGMIAEIENSALQKKFNAENTDPVLLEAELESLKQVLRETDWKSLCR
ncbi:MAG: response regulator [Desulfobacteraceae bacterium]|nr:response regulator [Desulfobacteraceae bacterium]